MKTRLWCDEGVERLIEHGLLAPLAPAAAAAIDLDTRSKAYVAAAERWVKSPFASVRLTIPTQLNRLSRLGPSRR